MPFAVDPQAAEIIATTSPLLIEGVAVPRALRRLLQDHPWRRPIEGLDGILGDILPRLVKLGVTVERRR